MAGERIRDCRIQSDWLICNIVCRIGSIQSAKVSILWVGQPLYRLNHPEWNQGVVVVNNWLLSGFPAALGFFLDCTLRFGRPRPCSISVVPAKQRANTSRTPNILPGDSPLRPSGCDAPAKWANCAPMGSHFSWTSTVPQLFALSSAGSPSGVAALPPRLSPPELL